MIFISQSGLTDPRREAAWAEWYLEHLRVMATVPGVTSAQRFETDTPGHAPSLAIYSVASPAVFEDPYYLSVRGFGDWMPLIDTHYYNRNLFEGLDQAPIVMDDERLLVADRERPEGPIAGIDFVWLECVGLDRTTAYRGLAVLSAVAVPQFDGTAAVYRPVTLRFSGSE